MVEGTCSVTHEHYMFNVKTTDERTTDRLPWVVGEDKRRSDAEAVEQVLVEYEIGIVPNLVMGEIKPLNRQNILGQL